MMTRDKFVQFMVFDPIVIAATKDATTRQRLIEGNLDMVIGELSIMYEFDFAMNEYSETATTAQVYELLGENDDCRMIYNVRYDSDKDLLDKKNPEDADVYLQSYAPSSPLFWIPYYRADRFPRIKIYGAPEAGKIIYYRYWRNNVTFEEVPDEFQFVLQLGIQSKFAPKLDALFQNKAAKMIGRYDGAAGDESPALLGAMDVKRNQHMNSHFGY